MIIIERNSIILIFDQNFRCWICKHFFKKNPFRSNLNYLLLKFKSKRIWWCYNFLLKIITFRISEKIKYVTWIWDWMKNATENLPKYANLNPLKLEEIPPKRWKHQLSQNEKNLLKLFKLKTENSEILINILELFWRKMFLRLCRKNFIGKSIKKLWWLRNSHWNSIS